MNSDKSNPPTTGASAAAEARLAPKKPGTVVYACSGCSDAGELADRIARRLTREGAAEMSCLAGIGGRVKPLVNRAASAERILAIDGCPLNCTRHTLELAGFKDFEHLELHKLGMKKNSCPVTDERVATGVEAAKKMLAAEPGGTGLRPVVPGVAPEASAGERQFHNGSFTRIQSPAPKSGATPDLTGVTPIPPNGRPVLQTQSEPSL